MKQIEPWYGTEYSSEPLLEELIKSWETCGRRDDLRLPEPNPMIATVSILVESYTALTDLHLFW